MYKSSSNGINLAMSCLMILSYMLLASSCSTAPVLPTTEEAEAAVIAKEKEALDQWSAGNPKGFTQNMADDVTYFDDIAAHSRLDGIEEMNKHAAWLDGKIPPHKYEMVDPKVQVYGEVAILTLQYHSTDAEGNPGNPWKATSVYRYSDGDWQIVHAHWSLVKQE